jgi:prolipoprotein diacylglyceryltransferase
VVPAAIALQFEPTVRIGTVAMRLETLALALVILGAILLVARIAVIERRRAARGSPESASSASVDLRLDDLLFLLLGAVPGAVIGGRLGSVLAHADFYADQPAAIIDPGLGGLSLGLAVLGGLVSALYVGRLLGAPLRAWAHVAVLPLLFGLAAGKVALAFGGTGQGLPSDLAWATAYTGSGAWGSLGPEVPSHPAQLYEALTTIAALVVVGAAISLGTFARRDGAALLVGLALWAAGRALVAQTWRDVPVMGPLGVEGLVSFGIVIGSVVVLVVLVALRRGAGHRTSLDELGEIEGIAADSPEWPDPSTRPRF